jgi:hypothetical protein
MAKIWLLLAAVSIWSSEAFAWGQEGHSIVAEIAQLAVDTYDPGRDCKPDPAKGDCVLPNSKGPKRTSSARRRTRRRPKL